MFNFVEAVATETINSDCKFGEIVPGHACYCHHDHEDAPRKCPLWRNGLEFNEQHCKLFIERGSHKRKNDPGIVTYDNMFDY